MKKIFNLKKYEIEIIVPKDLEYFMKAAHISQKTVFDKNFWAMNVEDHLFYSHKKHPTEKNYESFMPYEPLTKSRHIKIIICGFYRKSTELFQKNINEITKNKPLTKIESRNNGWVINAAYFDK